MPFITAREREWLAEGEAKGLVNGIQLGLKLRFGADGLALMSRVRQVADPGALGAFLTALETAPDLDALRALLPPEAPAGAG